MKNRSDLDFDVLKRLAEEPDEPKAVVTVIESKGSSPRGAGAKMIVYRTDGFSAASAAAAARRPCWARHVP